MNAEPILATLTPEEYEKKRTRKRKPPTPRSHEKPVKRGRKLLIIDEDQTFGPVGNQIDENRDIESAATANTPEPVEQQFNSNCCDRETQTVYDQYILGAKLETMILRNQSVVEERKESDLNLVNMMDPSVVLRDRKKTKFFTGLSPKRMVFTPGSQSPGIRK